MDTSATFGGENGFFCGERGAGGGVDTERAGIKEASCLLCISQTVGLMSNLYIIC